MWSLCRRVIGEPTKGERMKGASARAMLVDADERASAALATIPRSEFEAALATQDGPPELILDVTGYAGEGENQTAETTQLTVLWTSDELEEILRKTDGDAVTLAFDPEALLTAFGPEVEPHGMREAAAALAVAIVAGSAAGVASAGPVDPSGPAYTPLAGYTSIEAARSSASGALPVTDIEAVRTAAADTLKAAAGTPAVDIEAVRSAEAEATRLAAAAPTVDIEAVRSAEAEATRLAAAAPTVDIEAVRSAEAEAIRLAAATPATDIEAVRSAAAEAARAAPAPAGDGITVSMPSPAVTGALAGGMLLLITGAAFVRRDRQGPKPA
jgi:hypothetical protein